MCVKLPSVSKWGRTAQSTQSHTHNWQTVFSGEWESFIATQAYSAICKSQPMKEVKSGKRQKHWQMRRTTLSHINMPYNHVTEVLGYKHTYLVRSLTVLFFILHTSIQSHFGLCLVPMPLPVSMPYISVTMIWCYSDSPPITLLIQILP